MRAYNVKITLVKYTNILYTLRTSQLRLSYKARRNSYKSTFILPPSFLFLTHFSVITVQCGVAKGQGNNYCHNCGKPLAPDAAVCLNCGVANKQAPAPDAKSKLVAGLLAIFLGTFGVHNFYLGYTGKAVTQLVLSIVGILLCCVVVGVFIVMGVGIWGLVEGIMILTGKIDTDGKGNPLAD